MPKKMKIFTGNANPAIAKEICDYLGVPLGAAEVKKFSDGEISVEIGENVRGADVFVVQPTCTPVNDHLMELLIMIDALRRASARRITAVMPYYGYARQDRKNAPRVPISAKVVAEMLMVVGVRRVLCMDLHAGQIQGFFNIPVDELTALYLLSDFVKNKFSNNLVVVATDFGITKQARDVAERLGVPLAVMEKRRLGNVDKTEILNVIGDVVGKRAIIVDDEVDTAGSLLSVVNALIEQGAKEVYACATHAVFSGQSIQRIADSPIKNLVVTDTYPVPQEKRIDKITVLPIAPLLGEAIRRIHTGQSVGAMFE